MATSSKRATFRIAIGVLGLLMLTLPAPASAQGIFEAIFGGLRRSVEPPRLPENVQSFVDPLTGLLNANNPPRRQVEAGSGKAFCVRTCDGRYFPVQAHAGVSTAEACHSFCPASQTRLYSGGEIDDAVAKDGSRYADMNNAFVYRKRLVSGCTCNGRDAFGLAPVDAKTDPTLRPGDIVATSSGLVAMTGSKNKTAQFSPVSSSNLKVQRSNASAPDTTSSVRPVADKARDDDRRRAQLDR
jgi:Protein of unknown function (DUF2865)